MNIELYLLGKAQLMVDGEERLIRHPWFFPLMTYLALEGTCSRYEISTLLFGTNAKQFRKYLYDLHKKHPITQHLLKITRTHISLHESVWVDIKVALSSNQTKQDDTLQSPSLKLDKNRVLLDKNAFYTDAFERWLTHQRQRIAQTGEQWKQAVQPKPVYRRELAYFDEIDLSQTLGISTLLKQLHTWLHQPKGSFMLSLEGIGGIGKTTLAVSFAHEVTDRHVLLLTARSRYLNPLWGTLDANKPNVTSVNRSEEMLNYLLRFFGETPHGQYEQRVEQAKSHLSQEPTLIIVDNIERFDDLDDLIQLLGTFASTPTRILFTSRIQLRERFSSVESLSVPNLNAEDAIQLLQSAVPAPLHLDDADAHKLNKLIGGVPLALRLVGGLLGSIDFQTLYALLTAYPRHNNAQEGDFSDIHALFDFIYSAIWEQFEANYCFAEIDLWIHFARLMNEDGVSANWCFERLRPNYGEAKLEEAVRNLRRHYILSLGGNIHHPVYLMHSLTRQFILGGFYHEFATP